MHQTEEIAERCSTKKLFWKILQNSCKKTVGISLLTLIWVGFLGFALRWEGEGEINPLSKTRQIYARNLKFGTIFGSHTHVA